MARMPRVEFDGALYHLLCRGDRREAICQPHLSTFAAAALTMFVGLWFLFPMWRARTSR